MDWTIFFGIAIAIVIIGIVLFGVWRRIGGRPLPAALRPGRPLPEFRAKDEDGNDLESEDLRGQPAVVLFVRGNWCPFCSRQVADLTKHYKSVNDLGARLILITPRPLETTQRVAEFFDVDFEFWLDEDLAIAKLLGLVQTSGVPTDSRDEYGEDTVWPTSLVVDGEGTIRYASISRMIADRPNPQKFVQVLEAI